MKQEIATKLMGDTIRTLKAYYATYRLLQGVDAVVKKSGISEEKAIDIILEKYFSNIEDSLQETLINYSGDSKSCTFFAYKISMASNIFTESMSTHERYSLMLGCKLQINYLLRAVDSLTNVFSHCNFKLVEKSLLEKLENLPEDNRDSIMRSISDTCDINIEFSNALKEINVSIPELINLFKNLKKFYVGHDNIMEDELLYAKFCSIAPPEMQSLLQEYSSVLTRNDLAEIVEELENNSEAAPSIIVRLEDKINERSNGVALFEDFQYLFLEAVKNEDKSIRVLDITGIPFEIVAECIIKRRATQSLMGFIGEDREVVSKETVEFA